MSQQPSPEQRMRLRRGSCRPGLQTVVGGGSPAADAALAAPDDMPPHPFVSAVQHPSVAARDDRASWIVTTVTRSPARRTGR